MYLTHLLIEFIEGREHRHSDLSNEGLPVTQFRQEDTEFPWALPCFC